MVIAVLKFEKNLASVNSSYCTETKSGTDGQGTNIELTFENIWSMHTKMIVWKPRGTDGQQTDRLGK